MRIPAILPALLFGLASLGAAQSSVQSQAARSSTATSVKSDLLFSSEASPIAEFRSANQRLLGSIHIEEDRDNVCYTMRSDIVARDNRDSDSTRLVGYSTCQPSSKYELRITVEDSK